MEVAIFMYEVKPSVYKVSLRSNDLVDVSKVAGYLGGGGHKKAAGFTMAGTPHDVLNNLSGLNPGSTGGEGMIHGILNIYKKKGYTSHDVVAKLRGITGQRKIGHTGTLDPEAEGVLPVCLGRATKVCESSDRPG